MAHQIFLVYFILSACRVAGQAPTYALKGQQVNWKTDITEQPVDILWKHNGNKVVEFNGKEQQEYDSYEHRVTLGWDSAELTIDNLRFEDSGVYELEAFVNRKLHRSSYELKVIDKVSKPTITCQMDDGSDKTSGTLVCSAEPGQHQSVMKYEWSSHGNVQPGPQLIIPLGDKHDDEVYSCNVSNPLSSETATFTAKDCHPGQGGFLVPLIVSLVIIAVIIVLGIFIFIRYRKGKGNRNDSKNPQEEHEVNQGILSHEPEKASFKDKLKHFESRKDGPKKPKNDVTKKNSVEEREETQRLLFNKDADSHQVPVEPTERNNPKSDPSGWEKTNGLKSDGSEEEAGSDKKADEETPSAHANPAASKVRPPNVSPTNPAGEHKEESVSDQVIINKENEAFNGDQTASRQDEAPKQASEKEADKDVQSTASSTAEPPSFLAKVRPHNVAPTDPAVSDQVTRESLRESDSSDIPQRTNESYDPTEEKPSSADPELEDAETSAPEPDSNLLQDETREDDQPGRDKAGCEDENKSDRVGDGDSVQPQSSTPTKPDNSNTNTNTLQQPADTGCNSGESGGLSGRSTAEAYKGNVAEKTKRFENRNEPKNEDLNRGGFKNRPSKKNPASEKEADKDVQSTASSTAELPSPLAKVRPHNVAPTDPAVSDQVTRESLRESDSSDIPQRTNESYDPTEEKPSSADPELEDAETSAPEPDSNLLQDKTREDDQLGRDKAGCEDENKSDRVGDGDSVQPQSSTPTEPDNSNTNTNTLQQPADTGCNSGESGGLSGRSTAEAYKGNVAEKTKRFENRTEPKNEDLNRGGFKNRPSKKNPENEAFNGGQTASRQDEAPKQGSETEADMPPDMPSQDTAGGLKEVSDSETVRDSDSSRIHETRDQSGDSAEEKQSSAVPEQEGPETSAPDSNFSQGETNTRGENQQGADKPENENKSDNMGQSDSSTADKGEGGEMSSADKGQKKGEDVE